MRVIIGYAFSKKSPLSLPSSINAYCANLQGVTCTDRFATSLCSTEHYFTLHVIAPAFAIANDGMLNFQMK
jgi:hypothetical protein